jgi:hypothetical protein
MAELVEDLEAATMVLGGLHPSLHQHTDRLGQAVTDYFILL